MPGGLGDFLMSEDDGHLLRSIMRRIEALETATANDLSPGVVLGHPAPMRATVWSFEREKSVGAKWNRWYRLNDLNIDKTAENYSIDPVLQMTAIEGVGGLVTLGQPGGSNTEGGYSVEFEQPASLENDTALVTLARGWTLECLFMPEVAPQTMALPFYNGLIGSSGCGVQVGDAGPGPGSNLVLVQGGATNIDTGAVLVAKNWYHIIFVSDSVTNELHWYLGVWEPATIEFTFLSGTVPGMSATAIPSLGDGMSIGTDFEGRVDEALIYNGELTAIEAEDRIRQSLEPGPPSGFLKTDGAEVARTAYSRLFSRIGISSGPGDGSTTFELPTLADSIIKT